MSKLKDNTCGACKFFIHYYVKTDGSYIKMFTGYCQEKSQFKNFDATGCKHFAKKENLDACYENAYIPRTIHFDGKTFCRLHELAFSKNSSFPLLVLACCDYAIQHKYKNK